MHQEHDGGLSILKLFLALFFILLTLGGMAGMFMALRKPVRISQAEADIVADPALYMEPESMTVKENEAFDILLIANAKAERISAADIEVVYDSEILRADSLAPGPLLPVTLGKVKIENGKIRAVLGAEPGQPGQGIGRVATVRFTPLKSRNTRIKYGFSLLAVYGRASNALGSTGSSLVMAYPPYATLIPLPVSPSPTPAEISGPPQQPSSPGSGTAGLKADIDGNGIVDAGDYSLLVANFGTRFPAADFNANNTVDVFDYSAVLSSL